MREEARNLVGEIKTRRDEVESFVEWLTAETVHDHPAEAGRAAESIQGDPTASPIDLAVADAVHLQQRGIIQESIEKWRAVAIISEGFDKNRAAWAWFSVGYLRQEHGKDALEAAIDAYNEGNQAKA